MILYEHPFNERTRTYLRLEHLFVRLAELVKRDTAMDHHHAIVTIFEVMEVAGRAELKTDVLKDIERQKHVLNGYRDNPDIAVAVLDDITSELDICFADLEALPGKVGQSLTENDWLMGVRSRLAIPAGTCGFDLPAYHAWCNMNVAKRQQDLQRWVAPLVPLAEAVSLLLRLVRDSGSAQKVVAPAGQFQQMLPQGRNFQLLRLRLKQASGLIPEISCNRLMVSVRLMSMQEDGRLHTHTDDSAFELTLCA